MMLVFLGSPHLPGAAGDSNPVNRGSCPIHGAHGGLICPGCATLPPRNAR